jgi:Putative DNA-binding domain
MVGAEARPSRRGQAPSFAALVAPGLTDPNYAAPANLIGPNGKGATTRYNVYRNNVTVSLIDALAAIFPATQRITGVEFFRAMARFHVRATPPRSPLLFDYGGDFPEFIQSYDYAREMPWLADVARIERAWLDAYHAADVAALQGQDLAAVPEAALADLAFVPHPAARIICSEFPAVAIFAMNRGDGEVESIEDFVPEDALVTRPDQEVIVRLLPPGGAVFLSSLIAGGTLGEAAAAAFEVSGAFDLPGNIGGMIEAGVLAAIRDGDQR